MEKPKHPTVHRMARRSLVNNYSQPGMYHVTVRVAEGMEQPLGRVTGDARQADGSPSAPRVELSPFGLMVEQELLGSIPQHYPMVEIQDRVVMPEHLHFIVEVHAPIVSRQGKPQHLGQVIAGFKKGCNRRYWAMTGQEAPPTRTATEAPPPTRIGGIWKGLIAMLLMLLLTGCSWIEEDDSDCDKQCELTYELRLVTNISTEIQTQLTAETDVTLTSTLREHLSDIFTDFAHDVDLAFYDTTGDSLRLHHDEHIMDANQHSYSLNIPRQKYMHLAVANVVDNPLVELQQGDHCHQAKLQGDIAHSDTLSSHTTGLFTARQPMEMVENQNQTFNVRLYMANCAAALVIDRRGHDTNGIQVFTTGFATAFNIADSTYTYSQRPHIIRTSPLPAGSDELCFCSVTFPSPEPPATAARDTRTIIETTEPFVSDPTATVLWQIRVYVPQHDGTVTESILGISEPLRAGQLKILRCWLGDNGAIETDDKTVAVSVTLDWNQGGIHNIEL